MKSYNEALAHYELGGQEAYDRIISGHRRGVRNRQPMVNGEELSEDETYRGGDIYGKGSFFMHSLRYVIGDEVFLTTLKKLATDTAYTYDHFVTSEDVEKLFSQMAGKDLAPFFHFMLRTTSVLDLEVKEVGFQSYQIRCKNHFMDLPIDVATDKQTERMILTAEGLKIKSAKPPPLYIV